MTRIQILIAAVSQDTAALPKKMNIESDAIIINQCGKEGRSDFVYALDSGEECFVKVYDSDKKGVGLSRNMALNSAENELIQFCDEDIVLDNGYAKLIEKEFDDHPEADMILFNVKAAAGRETYHNEDFARVSYLNYGRYPAYAICARTKKLKEAGVEFSILFGGGAKYSNGEDSLFLHDCLKKKLKIYRTPVALGHEEADRPSTWFNGYTDKFFYDRGVLYKFLYGCLAEPMGFRFLFKNRKEMCKDKSLWECFKILRSGIKTKEV